VIDSTNVSKWFGLYTIGGKIIWLNGNIAKYAVCPNASERDQTFGENNLFIRSIRQLRSGMRNIDRENGLFGREFQSARNAARSSQHRSLPTPGKPPS
jgi:hypothetical protein